MYAASSPEPNWIKINIKESINVLPKSGAFESKLFTITAIETAGLNWPPDINPVEIMAAQRAGATDKGFP